MPSTKTQVMPLRVSNLAAMAIGMTADVRRSDRTDAARYLVVQGMRHDMLAHDRLPLSSAEVNRFAMHGERADHANVAAMYVQWLAAVTSREPLDFLEPTAAGHIFKDDAAGVLADVIERWDTHFAAYIRQWSDSK